MGVNMKELVAVLSPVEVFNNPVPEVMFKREALLFQVIGVPHLSCLVSDEGCGEDSPRLDSHVISHLEWLIGRGIIVSDPKPHIADYSGGDDERASLIAEIDALEPVLSKAIDVRDAIPENLKLINKEMATSIDLLKQIESIIAIRNWMRPDSRSA